MTYRPMPSSDQLDKTIGTRSLSFADLAIVLICLSILGQGLGPYLPALRYVQYAVPMAVALLWLTVGKGKWYPHSGRYMLATLMLLVSIGLSSVMSDIRDMRILMFLVFPISMGIFLKEVSYRHITWIWSTTVISAIIFSADNYTTTSLSFDIIYSGSIAEGQLSFVIAIFVITMFALKERRKLALAMILFLLMLKRIALGALLLSFAAWIVTSPELIRQALARSSALAVTLACSIFLVFGYLAFNLNTIAYEVFLQFRELFDTVERITLGRYKFAEAMTAYMDSSGSTISALFGFGPGSSRVIIGEPYFYMSDFNALNDYLLVRFEYGWAGLFLFFLAYAVAIGQSRWGVILCAFQALVFMTDNTLIYAFHTQVVVACSLHLMARERAES